MAKKHHQHEGIFMANKNTLKSHLDIYQQQKNRNIDDTQTNRQ